MSPRARDPGDPSQRLRRARSNLARARIHDRPAEVLYLRAVELADRIVRWAETLVGSVSP